MNNWIVIQNELSALYSSLPSQKIGEAYSVPEGYFDKFVSSMLERLQLDEASPKDELSHLSPFLSRISKKMPFSVPDDYFKQAAGEIPALINEDPLLQGWSKSMPYEMPVNYFQELPGKLLALTKVPWKGTKEISEAKIISINSVKWLRYAAAAIVVGVIALSSIFYFNFKSTSEGSSEEWLASKLKNVSNEDLEEFIKITDLSFTAIAQSEQTNKTEVRTLLNDVPDTELERFLDEIPADNGDLLMIN